MDGSTNRYLVDPNHSYAQVLEELDDSNNPTATYVVGHERISQVRVGSHSTFHADGLGSTRALSDGTGFLADEYGYSAYGESAYESGSTSNTYRYTGEQLDDGLGQYYLRARYYQPGVGRFGRMDEFLGTISSPITQNKYAYGNLNPIVTVDPSGKFGALSIGGLNAGINMQAVLGAAAGAAIGTAFVQAVSTLSDPVGSVISPILVRPRSRA